MYVCICIYVHISGYPGFDLVIRFATCDSSPTPLEKQSLPKSNPSSSGGGGSSSDGDSS